MSDPTVDFDDPCATLAARARIEAKPFLRQLYQEQYRAFAAALSDCPSGPRLELGSGGAPQFGLIPNLLRSDVIPLPDLDLVCSATALPFAANSLGGIVFMNVLHHIQDPKAFFREALRVLKPGGKIVFLEPGVTPAARMVYPLLHHEPFDPAATNWELPAGGRMSSANNALPWIIFVRDRARFEAEFPNLEILTMTPCLPFRYLLSGGVGSPWGLPGGLFPFMTALETLGSGLNPLLGLFLRGTVRKAVA